MLAVAAAFGQGGVKTVKVQGGTVGSTAGITTAQLTDSLNNRAGNYLPSNTTIQQKKQTLVVYIGGQSNEGTEPNSGRVDTVLMPSYLKKTYPNVYIYDNAFLNTQTFAPYNSVDAGKTQWGWLDQFFYRASNDYKTVIVTKRAIGGTKLAVRTGLTAWPRDDFKNRSKDGSSIAKSMFDTTQADIAILWGQGESDAITLEDAKAYGKNYTDLVKWMYDTLKLVHPIFVKRISNKQKDFIYRDTLIAKQDSFAAANYPNVRLINTDNLQALGELAGGAGDFGAGDWSHMKGQAAIKIGDMFYDTLQTYFGRTKLDPLRPVLTSAVIDTSGQFVTLNFSEKLNPGLVPYWQKFQIGTKLFDSIRIENNSVWLRPTIPFYFGKTYTLNYIKDTLLRENLADTAGNEVNSFYGKSVTNNVSSWNTEPTLTTLYTSNFSSGLDGTWAAFGANTTVTAPATSDLGNTNCAKVQHIAGGTSTVYKSTSSGFGVGNFRIEFDIEVPYSFSNTPSTGGFVASVQTNPSTARIFLKRYVIRNQTVHIEFRFNSTLSNDDIQIQAGNGLTGDYYFFKNFKLIKEN